MVKTRIKQDGQLVIAMKRHLKSVTCGSLEGSPEMTKFVALEML